MDLEAIRAQAARAIAPLTPADPSAAFWGSRTDAGRSLPPYYLVYFLLVDLLGFRDLGREEKVAFSIPVQINGTVLMIQHRKFGLGIFARDAAADDAAAQEAARRIQKAVKAAQVYFEHLADLAAKGSDLNVENNAGPLFERFTYFAKRYAEKQAEAEARKSEQTKSDFERPDGSSGWTINYPAFALRKEARWCATAAIEAFYSWTEHVFILVAILQGKIKTGEDVARLAGAEWKDKFKLALDIDDPATKTFYDQLTALRSQVRNFVAHGAFGKDRQALSFHSKVGAVPLLLPLAKNQPHFRFGNGVDILPPEAIQLIQDFIAHLWSGERSPAKIYIEFGLPLILSNSVNGTYARAMASDADMNHYADYLRQMFDNAENMDW